MSIKFGLTADNVTKGEQTTMIQESISNIPDKIQQNERQSNVDTQNGEQQDVDPQCVQLSTQQYNNDIKTKNEVIIDKQENSMPFALLTSNIQSDYVIPQNNLLEHISEKSQEDLNMQNNEQSISQSQRRSTQQFTGKVQTKSENKDQNMPFNQDQYVIFEIQHLPGYHCLAYFAYLPDLSARGYARRIGLAYITSQQRKLNIWGFNIAGAFQQAILCIKYSMTIAYRKDVLFYCSQLEKTLNMKLQEQQSVQSDRQQKEMQQNEALSPGSIIEGTISDSESINSQANKTRDSELPTEPICLSANKISEKGLKSDFNTRKSINHEIECLQKLKLDLLNDHIALHMPYVPFLFQLYQEESIFNLLKSDICAVEEIKLLQNMSNFGTEEILYEVGDSEMWCPQKLIPQNWEGEITIPPYELRLVKRQELRELQDIVGLSFYQYFRGVLKRVLGYYGQEYIDLQHDTQQEQFYVYQSLVDGLEGVYCGQKLFIPCQIDYNFLLHYRPPGQHAFDQLNIHVCKPKLLEYLQDPRKYEIKSEIDSQNREIRKITLFFPYEQLCDKFYARFFQMFPYLGIWGVPRLSSLSIQRPSYGHLFQMVTNYIPERHLRSLITHLLLGSKVVILTDVRWWGIILQEVLETFILGRRFQEQYSVVIDLTSATDVGILDAQLTIMCWQPAAAAVAAAQREVIQRTPAPVFYESAVDSGKSLLVASQIRTQVADEIVAFAKTAPTPFAISRFIETSLRVLIAQSFQYIPEHGEQSNKQIQNQQKNKFGDNLQVIERLHEIINTQAPIEHKFLRTIKKDEVKVGQSLIQCALTSGVSIEYYTDFQ